MIGCLLFLADGGGSKTMVHWIVNPSCMLDIGIGAGWGEDFVISVIIVTVVVVSVVRFTASNRADLDRSMRDVSR